MNIYFQLDVYYNITIDGIKLYLVIVSKNKNFTLFTVFVIFIINHILMNCDVWLVLSVIRTGLDLKTRDLCIFEEKYYILKYILKPLSVSAKLIF